MNRVLIMLSLWGHDWRDAKSIGAQSGVCDGSLYTTLNRLESDRWVRSRGEGSSRVYAITATGRRKVRPVIEAVHGLPTIA